MLDAKKRRRGPTLSQQESERSVLASNPMRQCRRQDWRTTAVDPSREQLFVLDEVSMVTRRPLCTDPNYAQRAGAPVAGNVFAWWRARRLGVNWT